MENTLTKDERKEEMLKLRFENRWPLWKIAEEFGISRERVRQIIGNTGPRNGGFQYGYRKLAETNGGEE